MVETEDSWVYHRPLKTVAHLFWAVLYIAYEHSIAQSAASAKAIRDSPLLFLKYNLPQGFPGHENLGGDFTILLVLYIWSSN